jgi:hypothetical protein
MSMFDGIELTGCSLPTASSNDGVFGSAPDSFGFSIGVFIAD